LKRDWSIAETPYPKKVQRLPQVLSPEDVAKLIDAADSPFHRILLMTLYATGARRAEVAYLKVSDIDSQRMVVHIRGGKGRKDRDVMLSPKLLEALRVYWHGLKRKPTDWLFPGNAWHTGARPVTTKVLWTACELQNVPVWNTNAFILIRCGAALLRICSKPAPTSVRFRCCSVIVTWKKRRSIFPAAASAGNCLERCAFIVPNRARSPRSMSSHIHCR
jgi:hypothetical protein